MHHFPDGFAGQEQISAAREHKLKANRRLQEELGGKEGQRLLANDDIATLVSRGASILSAAQLIAPFESAAFHDAMLEELSARACRRTLCAALRHFRSTHHLLQSTRPCRIKIDAFCLDSTSIKVRPDDTGALNKADQKP